MKMASNVNFVNTDRILRSGHKSFTGCQSPNCGGPGNRAARHALKAYVNRTLSRTILADACDVGESHYLDAEEYNLDAEEHNAWAADQALRQENNFGDKWQEADEGSCYSEDDLDRQMMTELDWEYEQEAYACQRSADRFFEEYLEEDRHLIEGCEEPTWAPETVKED